ncbi:MAG: TetR/AcrR family transcriptional regulator [Sporichthyaceae bacterium]|nr:TetR/AcrR family transcriptional regulator [Sporichthyaceae bacterium]
MAGPTSGMFRAAGCGRRRRGEALETAIIDAVLALLREVGYEAVTMEGIAARAHTGKAALYRRWASKADLVVDVLQRCLAPMEPPPDRGNIRDDLIAVLRRLAAVVNSPAGCAIPTLTTRDRAFVELVAERVVVPQQRMLVGVLRRGIERGDVRPELPLALVAEVGPSMLLKRALADGPPVRDGFVVSVVDDLLLPMVRPQVTSSPPATSGEPVGLPVASDRRVAGAQPVSSSSSR